jgi:hypothetical protein
VERVTGIEPALSAWELACQVPATTVAAGQPPFLGARECPLDTASDSPIGHATGTLLLANSTPAPGSPSQFSVNSHLTLEFRPCFRWHLGSSSVLWQLKESCTCYISSARFTARCNITLGSRLVI